VLLCPHMNATYPDAVTYVATLLGLSYTVTLTILIVLAVWSLMWKGLGLWRSARNAQKWWFLAFLIINDLGILPIIYLLWFRNDKKRMMPPVAEASSDVVSAA
jgi:hypothetical protein